MKKLYYNGDILSMKDREDAPEAVVTQDAEILYAGSLAGAKAAAGADAQTVDLQGHTLLPGFIDPHSHFFQTAQSIDLCDLSEAKDFSDIVRLLQEYIQSHGLTSEDLVTAMNYDHNFLAEGVHPDRTVLDRASETVPIYVSHTCGHMGAANSALLKLAGVTKDAPDPAGGHFGRDTAGEPTGYIEEVPAIMQVLSSGGNRMKVDMVKQLGMAQELYYSHGVTTAQEGAAGKQTVEGLAQLAKAGLLTIDVVSYVMQEEYVQTAAALPEYVGQYVDHVKIGGSKIILDGSPQGRTAWLSAPYEVVSEGDDPTWRSQAIHPDAYVKEACLDALEDGHQILCHCNGDAASEQFLNGYEAALREAKDPKKDIRPVMVHCQTIREDQIDRLAALEMVPSVFIGHVYYWGDVHVKNLGETRAVRISPLKSIKERGLLYNLHQDTPVTKPDMLHSVWTAVNRKTRGGRVLGPQQAIDVYDALKGVTIHAAYAYHEEDVKGTIEPGKAADLVILEKNPLKVPAEEIQDIRVLETIKGGETVYHR